MKKSILSRRLLALAAAGAIVTGCFLPLGSSMIVDASYNSATSSVNGDVTGDNEINIFDALQIRRNIIYQAWGYTASNGAEMADVSADSVVDVADASLLMQFIHSKVYEFPEKPIPPVTSVTLDDMPDSYDYAMNWIWDNRVQVEQSTARRNTIFDQIVAGKGTINYVVRWHSEKEVTYEQRQQFEVMLEDAINMWTDWLVGYENWPYDHIDVSIVGWAVLDKKYMLDIHEDEIIYDNILAPYDSTYDTQYGDKPIPTTLPSAPSELSRFDHFTDTSYQYPGGLDKRFDMYMWATQGFPPIGGCGGDWGQRLSDDAYLNMLTGYGLHVFVHELGHGFGMTDFYGGEGASDGFPPGGFPGNGSSIMMAGSSAEITDFDGWTLRYFWSQIKDEYGRFNF